MRSEPNEDTPFVSTGIPQPVYNFESSILRVRKRRLRQFQCCVCIIFLSLIITAIVISLAFDINANDNNTAANDSSSMVIPLERWNFTTQLIDLTSYPEAVSAAAEDVFRKVLAEDDTPQAPNNSASFRHQKVMYTFPTVHAMAQEAYFDEFLLRKLSNHSRFSDAFQSSHKFCYFNSTRCNLQVRELVGDSMQCNVTRKYRTFNGSCNNLKYRSSGVARTPFLRHLPPAYADGINAPRKSVTGDDLPSARLVSLAVHRPLYFEDAKFTIMLAVFGQFLDHDITSTASTKRKDGQTIACCDLGNGMSVYDECFPVLYEQSNNLTDKNSVQCIEFLRSSPASSCCLGAREQLNQVTSFIDGSAIYGDEDNAPALRNFINGSLRMYKIRGKELLPPSMNLDDGCNRQEEASKGRYCFATGDGRANENLHLTSMHLLWAREHNRIAAFLSRANAHWTDEEIYMETRKIVGAQLQHITYNEFLPILFGLETMRKYDMLPLKQGYSQGYNEDLDASAFNVFATAAFRFAHTLIPSVIRMTNNASDLVALRDLLLNPFKLYEEEGIDDVLGGALHTHIEANDPYFSNELKQHLFEGGQLRSTGVNGTRLKCGNLGLDLVSLNIQRGRDHGIAGYTSWQQRCGQRRAHNFSALGDHIDDESLARITSVYSHVDDIDLYTGAVSERPLRGGFLGPTFTCLILDQFYRLKHGDRFWYERKGQFSDAQLDQLRNASLARIICDNSDNVDRIQLAVMRRIGDDTGNPVVNCSRVPEMDLNAWLAEDNNRLRRVRLANDEGVNVVARRH